VSGSPASWDYLPSEGWNSDLDPLRVPPRGKQFGRKRRLRVAIPAVMSLLAVVTLWASSG